MYLLVGCIFAIILFTFLFCGYRRKRARKRLCAMSYEEKLQTLETVISPFGYCYDPAQDCFQTTIDAPQRMFGYTALFDRYAPRFDMVFDCMPIYFDYQERTWLIEFWKGQYGINLGCEVGIYKAEGLVAAISRKTTLFHSVEDEEMLPMSVRLFHKGELLIEESGRHWWLTAFRMGAYCEPRDLEVQIGITFQNTEMLHAFAGALHERGDVEYVVSGLEIRVLFSAGAGDCCTQTFMRRVRCRYVQWKNRQLCRLFVRVTKPFICGMDRLLELYFCLPRLIRRVFCQRKREHCCQKSCHYCNQRGCWCRDDQYGYGKNDCRCGENRRRLRENEHQCGRSCKRR